MVARSVPLRERRRTTIERTHRKVREAAIALLGERGYAAFNMEAVADATGVSKSTLYRHWPTKLTLIADALEALNEQPRPGPSAGEVRQRDGVVAGELPADFDAEMAALALSGAVFYRRTMTPEPFAVEDVPALVSLVLGEQRRLTRKVAHER